MTKYLIKAKVEVNGVVEKHDIIGAIFGQTEGLLGEQFDLRALQDKGRIGRIQVNTRTYNGKTVGEIIIPSNLDRIETALIAAMIESVERVGPYNAKIQVVDIIDVRMEKIKRIVERAKEILRTWSRTKSPDLKEILLEIQQAMKTPEPIKYGPENLPAGPDVERSDTVILVEGRADVINLLRYGITNTIALGGARKVPETIANLAKRKKIIAFLDGDHGGDLILKEILRSIKVDKIARAPPGKEVEELTGREIKEALSKAIPTKKFLEELIAAGSKEAQYLLQVQERLSRQTPPVQQAKKQVTKAAVVEEKPKEKEEKKEKVEKEKAKTEVKHVEEVISIPKQIKNDIKSLLGTLEAILYTKDWKPIKRIPVRDLVNVLDEMDERTVYAIVFDGIVTQRLVEKAGAKKVKLLIGAKIGKINEKPQDIIILTFNDLL
ncbi:MAG: DNA primase [Crenarchaeota archaeon]|nr:DNA primase [Thermoproteota archaeon]